jgi:O-acetyl-ADP-ribose deacetylase (regulator of RNase III)
MPTRIVKGDLFNTPGILAYAHGCNCAGTMDAGVSVAFKKRWPAMFEDYAARCADGRVHLGDVVLWTEGEVSVYSLAIQEHWKKRAKLAALSRAVRRMVSLAEHAGVAQVGLPRVGAGLGGLEWPRVKSALEEIGAETTVTLVAFEQFVRAEGTGKP